MTPVRFILSNVPLDTVTPGSRVTSPRNVETPVTSRNWDVVTPETPSVPVVVTPVTSKNCVVVTPVTPSVPIVETPITSRFCVVVIPVTPSDPVIVVRPDSEEKPETTRLFGIVTLVSRPTVTVLPAPIV